MQQVLDFLNTPLITVADRAITVYEVLIVPTAVLLGLFVIRWLGRIVRNRLVDRGVNPDVVQLISRAFYILGIAVLVITTLDLINVPLTAFAFVSGAVAIGVGFGAQNIINNFISGWILMWERPIRIGDFLEVGDTKGTVEMINTRSTRIRRTDGVHLMIPNSFLLENTVVNWTLVNNHARSIVRVGVAYGSPVEQVASLIKQAVEEQDSLLSDKSVDVVFEDFGDSALIFDAYFWIDASGDRDLRLIRSDIRFRIDALFREHDITIAFPQRDVHVDGLLRVDTSQPPFASEKE